MTELPVVIDRSRMETFADCPRKGYWHYLYGGLGIEAKPASIPLTTGSLVHEPLARVLQWVKGMGNVPEPSTVKAFVNDAQREYLRIAKERGLLLDAFDGSDSDVGKVLTFPKEGETGAALAGAALAGAAPTPVAWQLNEQLALLEALVKGWVRVGLPRLLGEFEVVDVEQEQEVELGGGVIMLTRRDALLRRRSTGEFYVLNFKTTSNADSTWVAQWRYDQQTISEMVAAEASVGGEVRGVIIEGLVKGQRKLKWPEDVEPEQWRHNSPLLYHYTTVDVPPAPRGFSASGYWTCPEAHKWQWAKGGQCPGGQKHKLGKEWYRDMVGQTCGIDVWLDWLETNEPEVLRAQFLQLPAILRSAFEVERWKRQTIAEATRIDTKRRVLEESDGSEAALDVAFPMATGHGNCLRPSRCPYLDLCFGVADPEDPERFVRREPNHPKEKELRK